MRTVNHSRMACLVNLDKNQPSCFLLRDAAHAMTQHAASRAATTTEDAEVLGYCLATCASPSDLPSATKMCENTRKQRYERIREFYRQNAMTFSMPNGPSTKGTRRGTRQSKRTSAPAAIRQEKLRHLSPRYVEAVSSVGPCDVALRIRRRHASEEIPPR